ncbi:MAG: sigma 54-interacting transcriptional regulator [Bacteroidales bacterium]|nr:sigma 54-interacting transcriptional regulator [Bacteroidales bacterium]
MDIQSIKQRFEIIGNAPQLNRAIDIAMQVASTDLTVLITGESGVGKESFPKIIHTLSPRKHGNYIAVNCGAIPEGTIDSELFGHEKGSFTGAVDSRKGYFEVADGGTIFLDEVAELPLATQVRLLRVLETGEFIRVGSSKVIKTNVRVVAATNVNIPEAIEKNRFREDLYYRLNTVPILVPPLRSRGEDIVLLFRKFASDFSLKYRMPPLQLTDDAKNLLLAYNWKGNVRQLKNITEQISIIEKERIIDASILSRYLPETHKSTNLPVLFREAMGANEPISERDLLYKVLFEMKRDINDLKQLVRDIVSDEEMATMLRNTDTKIIRNITADDNPSFVRTNRTAPPVHDLYPQESYSDFSKNDLNYSQPPIQESEVVDESLSLADKEIELIKRALKKHNNKRKDAADDLGISERTLYRKIKEYKL